MAYFPGQNRKRREKMKIKHEIVLDNQKWYWKNWGAYQGCAYIFLTRREKATSPVKKMGDIIVANVQRWGKVTIRKLDLLKECPFSFFDDGFHFHHPTGAVHYDNYDATSVLRRGE
jgi:hypothetical protein